MSPTLRRRLAAGLAALGTFCVSITPGLASDALRATFSKQSPASSARVDHSMWDRLLKTHVRSNPDGINRLDYAGLKAAGGAGLDGYLAMLAATDPKTLARAEQIAFWINLYNAHTLALVLARYPVASIRDINLPDAKGAMQDGPWKAPVATIAGQRLSLDDIENAIVRPIFKDARVHYAFNCLSLGCPNLLAEAYTGAKLEAQLTDAATTFINHPRAITVTGTTAKASSIYEWFVDDFGGAAGVKAHLLSHARPELRGQVEAMTAIAAYDYDWTLNDAAR